MFNKLFYTAKKSGCGCGGKGGKGK